MVAVVTPAGGTISLLIGAVLLRLTFTGTYGRYVRVGMAPWLAVAGIAVFLLGLATLLRALGRSNVAGVEPHDHGPDRVGWLLLAPIAALLLVAPPTLGSYGVGRGATVDVRAGTPVFDDLHAGGEPVPMTLLEFGQRAFERDGVSFNGAEVDLTGFVAQTRDDGFELARYQIACCAADATPVVVDVTGVFGDIPQLDEWVTVTGVFQAGGDPIPRLAATVVRAIPPPNDPYE
jgi:uncharacterized repeat protein (TIGR03943 family)